MPPASYPGVDRLSERFVHHVCESRRVELSPALAQVIAQAAVGGWGWRGGRVRVAQVTEVDGG